MDFFEIKKTDRIKSICTDVGERDACKIEKVQEEGECSDADHVISDMRSKYDYKIVLMKHAEEDLDRFIAYLLFEKKRAGCVRNLLNDFEATKKQVCQMLLESETL